MSDESRWVNAIVREWIEIVDEATLRAWIRLCDKALVKRGAKSSLEVDATGSTPVFCEGKKYFVTRAHYETTGTSFNHSSHHKLTLEMQESQ